MKGLNINIMNSLKVEFFNKFRVDQMSRKEIGRYYGISLPIIFIIFYLFYHSLILCNISLVLAIPLAKYYEEHLEKERKKTLNLQFKDLLYSISASVSAGRQMTEALEEGRENMKMIYRQDAPIILELDHIMKGIREAGFSEEQALINFSSRCKLEDVENFVDTYLICRTTGGDVEKVVLKGAQLIMEKIAIEKEIMTVTSQKKFEAKILTAMPLGMLALMQFVSPEYMAVLYESFAGRLVMTAALLGILLSYYFSSKILDIRL